MAEAEEKKGGEDETKSEAPFFVWPWILCTADSIGPYWKGALMCIGMFGTAAGVQLCEPYPIWCIGSAGFALVCSILAQRELYLTGNLKKIHHGLEIKNKMIIEETETLKWSMDKNKEHVEGVFICEIELLKQVEKLEEVAGKQEVSRLAFDTHVDKLLVQRQKIKTSFEGIQRTLRHMYGSDDRLARELDTFTTHIEDLTDCEAEMTQDLNTLKKTYNKLKTSKQRMDDELKAFNKMRQVVEDAGIKWTKDIIGMTQSMKNKYKDLFQLCMTFSTNFLKEIVHNIEYMDGKSGWTMEKFKELLRRLPNNVRAKADFRTMRMVFKRELRAASKHKESKIFGHNFVSFEVFQKEIVQKHLLPLCDVFSSGADNIVVDTDTDDESESSEMKEVPTSAEVEL